MRNLTFMDWFQFRLSGFNSYMVVQVITRKQGHIPNWVRVEEKDLKQKAKQATSSFYFSVSLYHLSLSKIFSFTLPFCLTFNHTPKLQNTTIRRKEKTKKKTRVIKRGTMKQISLAKIKQCTLSQKFQSKQQVYCGFNTKSKGTMVM